MVEPKHLHSILLLLLPHRGAEAQSPPQPVPPFASYNSWDPSLAIVIAALVGTFLFLALFSIFLRHCVESFLTQQQRNPDWPCSCSQGIHGDRLNTFPILFFSTIKDFHLGKGALECAVCLAEFTDHDTLRLLPQCNHVFHPPCIDAWLSSHVTCPVCRANLNQDLAQVAILVATQLSASVAEGSGSRAEEQGGGESGTEQCPVVHNASEGQNKVDEHKGWPDRGSKSKLLRSNSTGHSLVEPGECVERYTLRLPEDVRKYILVNHGVMQRSASYNVVGSSRRGRLWWSDSEGGRSIGKRNNSVGLRGEGSLTGKSSNTCSALPGFCS